MEIRWWQFQRQEGTSPWPRPCGCPGDGGLTRLCNLTLHRRETTFCPEGSIQRTHPKDDPCNFSPPFLAFSFEFYSRRAQLGTAQVS